MQSNVKEISEDKAKVIAFNYAHKLDFLQEIQMGKKISLYMEKENQKEIQKDDQNRNANYQKAVEELSQKKENDEYCMNLLNEFSGWMAEYKQSESESKSEQMGTNNTEAERSASSEQEHEQEIEREIERDKDAVDYTDHEENDESEENDDPTPNWGE